MRKPIINVIVFMAMGGYLSTVGITYMTLPFYVIMVAMAAIQFNNAN